MEGDRCTCLTPPFWFEDFERTDLGEDASGAEVALETCKVCGRIWLKYLIEEPHYSRSARWWRAAVPEEELSQLSAASAREFIERQASCFVGGSGFGSSGRETLGPVHIA
ncbi:MAG TPA: hypothetical protein VFS20_11145 [Longimicrobium sp.]|nr:hypothetical protein [Longimicrobium sp.]